MVNDGESPLKENRINLQSKPLRKRNEFMVKALRHFSTSFTGNHRIVTLQNLTAAKDQSDLMAMAKIIGHREWSVTVLLSPFSLKAMRKL